MYFVLVQSGLPPNGNTSKIYIVQHFYVKVAIHLPKVLFLRYSSLKSPQNCNSSPMLLNLVWFITFLKGVEGVRS